MTTGIKPIAKVFKGNPTALWFYGANDKIYPVNDHCPLWFWPDYMTQTHIQVNYSCDITLEEVRAIKKYLSTASTVMHSLNTMYLYKSLGNK